MASSLNPDRPPPANPGVASTNDNQRKNVTQLSDNGFASRRDNASVTTSQRDTQGEIWSQKEREDLVSVSQKLWERLAKSDDTGSLNAAVHLVEMSSNDMSDTTILKLAETSLVLLQHSNDYEGQVCADGLVLLMKLAVQLAYNEQSDASIWLYALGVAQHMRCVGPGISDDLESAIVHLKQAVDLSPNNSPVKELRMNQLSAARRARLDSTTVHKELRVHLLSAIQSMHTIDQTSTSVQKEAESGDSEEPSQNETDKSGPKITHSSISERQAWQEGSVNIPTAPRVHIENNEAIATRAEATLLDLAQHQAIADSSWSQEDWASLENLVSTLAKENAAQSKPHSKETIILETLMELVRASDHPCIDSQTALTALASSSLLFLARFKEHKNRDDSQAVLLLLRLGEQFARSGHSDPSMWLYACLTAKRTQWFPDTTEPMHGISCTNEQNFDNPSDGLNDLAPVDDLYEALLLMQLKDAAAFSLGHSRNTMGEISKPMFAGCYKEDEGEDAGLLSSSLSSLVRFERHGDQDDLKMAIQQLGKVLDTTPESHPNILPRLYDYGRAQRLRFESTGNPDDIDAAIAAHTRTIKYIFGHAGHSLKAGLFSELAYSYELRFKHRGNPFDLDMTIEYQSLAALLTPDGKLKPAMLYLLGQNRKDRFDRAGNLYDLEAAIEDHIQAIRLFPEGHTTLRQVLISLRQLLETLAEHQNRTSGEVECMFAALTHTIKLIPDDGSEKPAIFSKFFGNNRHFFMQYAPEQLMYLWKQLHSRYVQHVTDVHELRYAKHLASIVLPKIPDHHPVKCAWLNNLSAIHHIYFDRLGTIHSLVAAVTASSRALKLAPAEHSELSAMIANLGALHLLLFKERQDPADLHESVSLCRRAVDLASKDDSSYPHALQNLASTLAERFRRLENISDLDSAITMRNHAISMLPRGHASEAAWLGNLGHDQEARFKQCGTESDLEAAVISRTRANDLTPIVHPEKAARLADLGSVYLSCFDHCGRSEDLEAAITACLQAVERTTDSHASRHDYLHDLAMAWKRRFRCFSQLDDLEKAIVALERAIKLTPAGYPALPHRLGSLGASQYDRFRRFGSLHHLDLAIENTRKANDQIPDRHKEKPRICSNLGLALFHRFKSFGNLADVEDALAAQRTAFEQTPDGHAQKPLRWNHLGITYLARFDRLGSMPDLMAAISAHTQAVRLAPDEPLWLNNLGADYHASFMRSGSTDMLLKAITTFDKAVQLTPEDHPDLPVRLGNLGAIHLLRFEHKELKDFNGVETAISLLNRATRLMSDKDPHKATVLSTLANAHHLACTHLGSLDESKAAITARRQALELIPTEHAMRTLLLLQQGDTYILRASSCFEDLMEAINAYKSSASQRTGDPAIKLRAGTALVELLSRVPLSSERLLEAHQLVLELIPQVVWLGHDVNRRYKELERLGSFSNRAAADALAVGQYSKAVEWLESGRSVVWSQLLRLRTPLEDLKRQDPQLAAELEQVSSALQASSDSIASDWQSENDGRLSLVAQSESHYQQAIKYDTLVSQIRGIAGFENFLRARPSEELVPPSSVGPVVIINVHPSRCDALILYSGHPVPTHVPLTSFSYEAAEKLQADLHCVLRAQNISDGTRRYGDTTEDYHDRAEDRQSRPVKLNLKRQQPGPVKHGMEGILGDLWIMVVKPILERVETLAQTMGDSANSLLRITWCPTGPLVFLPLHAAGLYTEDGPCPSQTLMDFAVSSYTTNLENLLRYSSAAVPITPHAGNAFDLAKPRFLVVAKSTDTEGNNKIPNTVEEAKIVEKLLGSSAVVSTCREDQATVDRVLDGIMAHDCIHLACHGIQDVENPTQSGFALDRRLTLSMLMNKELPNAELAVLSACQTATGDKRTPEEAVHLVAAMLSVGFKSVVGTMWSIDDEVAPKLMETFYEVLKRDLEAGMKLRPRYALHEAVMHLRRTDKLVHWVPFVQYGL